MPEAAIVVDALGRRFGAFQAVEGVSFEVSKGEIFGYLGANGAGKSTTIRMLCGLLRPTAGRASVAGFDVGREPDRVKSAIGYMSQRFSLFADLTVAENFDFFGGMAGLSRKRVRDRVEALHGDLDLNPLLDRVTGSLPGGLRQRVALASALLHSPSIVFLDEPTAGVDPASRREFWTLIRHLARAGTTVFVTTHNLDEAEFCARVGMMVAGRLVALDTPLRLKATWVPGVTVALESSAGAQLRRRAAEELRTWDGVLSVEPFGLALHVRVDATHLRAAEVVQRIAPILGQTTAHEVTPTLEDVFLAIADPRTEARIRREQGTS